MSCSEPRRVDDAHLRSRSRVERFLHSRGLPAHGCRRGDWCGRFLGDNSPAQKNHARGRSRTGRSEVHACGEQGRLRAFRGSVCFASSCSASGCRQRCGLETRQDSITRSRRAFWGTPIKRHAGCRNDRSRGQPPELCSKLCRVSDRQENLNVCYTDERSVEAPDSIFASATRSIESTIPRSTRWPNPFRQSQWTNSG